MGSLFYNLGKRVGPGVRKGRWVWSSLTGSEAEAYQAGFEVGWGALPISPSSLRWFHESTHSKVAHWTASMERQGAWGVISSVL